MADIFGRSVSRSQPGVTIGQVKSLIRDSIASITGDTEINDVQIHIEDKIAETINLASVDPDKIVLFFDRRGKLKTSNASLDDILVRRRGVIEDSIALYSNDGKLKPGVRVSTFTDKLSTVDISVKSLSDKYNNQ